MPKAVEVMVVWDDGTVERCEGEAAARYKWFTMFDLNALVAVQESVPDLIRTKPLRKVTRVTGHEMALNDGIIHRNTGACLPIGHFLPRGGRGTKASDGPLCKFRITVEAIPVEDIP